jgi:UPF0271 protein
MSGRAVPLHVIDLNADVGEGYDDQAILPLVTSANVACGAHAGDEATARATLRLCRAHGVAVGAHPGFDDRAGFGRRVTTQDPGAIAELVARQIAWLAALATGEQVALTHVKPHGGLYNLSAVDRTVADAIARTLARVAPGTRLIGLAGSFSLAAAADAGLDAVGEAFVDRGYLGDGTLAPRDRPGAVITDAAEAARRALHIARREPIETVDGARIVLRAGTLCLHGDTPGAAAHARAVRAALLGAGIQLAALG